MTTVLDIIDTAVKIGLGALIAGLSTYFLSKRNHLNELEKSSANDQRELAKDLATRLAQVSSITNESAMHYHHKDLVLARKTLVPASEGIEIAVSISYILGCKSLISSVSEMADCVDEMYITLAKNNPSHELLNELSDRFSNSKAIALPLIHNVYKTKNT